MRTIQPFLSNREKLCIWLKTMSLQPPACHNTKNKYFKFAHKCAKQLVNAKVNINHFFSQLDSTFTGEELFDHFPDCVFFIKNANCQYLVVNQTLVTRCGFQKKEDLLGKTAFQVLPEPLGHRFTKQDRSIIESGKPLESLLELHLFPSAEVGWCLTNKIALKNKRGEVSGLVGISRDLRIPDLETDAYQRVASAIEYAKNNLSEPLSVEQLASVANVSRFQLDRRMRLVFGLSAGQWIKKTRIDYAQRLLTETDTPILQIAIAAGYADQSAFTRQFKKATGLTPRNYRKARQQLLTHTQNESASLE